MTCTSITPEPLSLEQAYIDSFALARNLGRKLVLLVGPTNSGKTFEGMNALANADSGCYLAPLRLLAQEGRESLEQRGVLANLITGEEQQVHPGARFVSSTVEMADFTTPIAAALIDECQMIADLERGWAWTQAIVGIPARTVYLAGSPVVLPMLTQLAERLGESLEVRRFERLSPLKHKVVRAGSWEAEQGTAIIAFTRNDVLGLKQTLEAQGVRTAVIYGALPPEVRRKEAERFSRGEATILVATDAIAMGLNLPIKHVHFYKMSKWNGKSEEPLSDMEILQIAGRAGRFGKHATGYVSTSTYRKRLRALLADTQELRIEQSFQVRPTLDQLQLLVEEAKDDQLEPLLRKFASQSRQQEGLFTPVVPTVQQELAPRVDRTTLDLPTRFVLSSAPVNVRCNLAMRVWDQAIQALEHEIPLPCPEFRRPLDSCRKNHQTLLMAEDRVKALTLYLWLAFRFPNTCIGLDAAQSMLDDLNSLIADTLQSAQFARRCVQCDAILDPFGPSMRCRTCEGGMAVVRPVARVTAA